MRRTGGLIHLILAMSVHVAALELCDVARAQAIGGLPDSCGTQPDSAAGRSLSKRPASMTDWPGIAALRLRDEANNVSQYFCGASVVHKNWVLTAAHCVEAPHKVGPDQFQTDDNRKFEIVIGVDHLDRVDAGNVFTAREIISHEKYWKPAEGETAFDVALIRLSRPWPGEIAVLGRLPPLTGASLLMRSAGFGATFGSLTYNQTAFTDPQGGRYCSFTRDLNEQALEQVAIERCRAFGSTVDLNKICTGRKSGGEDTCVGDSGGPLMMSRAGLPVQVGVVSWGPTVCGAAGGYGVYSRVSVYDEWIAIKTGREVMRTPMAAVAMSAEQTQQLAELEALIGPAGKTARLILRSRYMKQRHDFRIQVYPEVNGRILLWDVTPDGRIDKIDTGANDIVSRFKLYEPPALSTGSNLGQGRFIVAIVPTPRSGDAVPSTPPSAKTMSLTELIDLIRKTGSNAGTASAASKAPGWGYDSIEYEIE